VHIQWIQIVDFRNYETLSYSPDPHLNILSGPNGHGKTNLLEALAVLLVGRSFRGARPLEMSRWDTGGAALSGAVQRGDSHRVIRRHIAPREDGVWSVGGEGCEWTRAVPFGWQDLGVVNGTPHARRNFVDGFAGKVWPAHLESHARYRQVVARRNHLLQRGMDRARLETSITPWDEQAARLGVEIVARRQRAVEALAEEIVRIHPSVGGRGTVGLAYRSSFGEGATVDGVRETLARRRGEEMRRGQTLIGPHRDDVRITLDGRDITAFGSRGQQRLLALSLRLAEARPVATAVGTTPILLLDDALSELDAEVQGRVLRHAEEAGQVFLTSADGALCARRGRRWRVTGGRVEDLAPALVRGAA
jgi:DNA replication and repair protein RecF